MPNCWLSSSRPRVRRPDRMRQAASVFAVALLSLPGSARAVAAAKSDASAIRPFKVQIPQAALDDLRRRVAATRWPDKETVADPSQGVPLARLQELVRYWGSGYDWRRV